MFPAINFSLKSGLKSFKFLHNIELIWPTVAFSQKYGLKLG